MRIAVCDDEHLQSDLLCGYVSDWGRARHEPVEISVFRSGEAFLFAWDEDKAWDALLLDIQMDGIDGMALARQLRGEGSALPIVFITGFGDYMSEGFEVEALHYLLKPVDREKLYACLDRALQRAGQGAELLVDTVGGEALRLPQRELAALEAVGHHTHLTLADGSSVEVKAVFMELAGQLPAEDFVQCHRSYMVGLRHIRRLGKEQIVLDSGLLIPVSRRLFGHTNAAFIAFYRRDSGEEVRQ